MWYQHRYVLVSIFVLFLAILVPLPAAAAGETITINPVSGPPGTTVTVAGEGWPNDWTVPIGTDASPGAQVTARADAQGEFTIKLTIPGNAPAGQLRIWAVIGNGGSADAWFTVEGPARGGQTGDEPDCAVKVIGVHGMGEGPNDSGYGDSRIVRDTLKRVRDLAVKRDRPALETVMLRYPTTDPLDLFKGRGGLLRPMRKMAAAVDVGVTRLEREIAKWRRYCSTTKFGLVGYSEGAWVIDEYLSKRAGKVGWEEVYELVRGVQVYGDPQWPDKYSVGPGIAFRAGEINSAYQLDLSPYDQDILPYQGFCIPDDIVCDPKKGKALIYDLKPLQKCLRDVASCPHGQYTRGGTARGATFLDSVLYE
ncbi:hypothetical protein GCM10009556_066240 [Acrocarpospora pleiomorpha]